MNGRSGSPLGYVYLRRHLGESDLEAVEADLRHGSGPFLLEKWGWLFPQWTRISLWDERDLDRIRKTFPHLIDGFSVG